MERERERPGRDVMGSPTDHWVGGRAGRQAGTAT